MILKSMVAACAALLFAGVLGAQAASNAELSSPDAGKADCHDRPIGGIRLKLPEPAPAPGQPPTTKPASPPPAAPNPTPPSEGEDIPPTETPPNPPPPEDPPTYYGEPIQGKFVFQLDASGSMAGSRIASLRAETKAVIRDLTDDDEFDCLAYGSQFGNEDGVPFSRYSAQTFSRYLWGAIQPATTGNKGAARAWIDGPALNPGRWTPTYASLCNALKIYPSTLTKYILVTDGEPNITGSASEILQDFPGWFKKFTDCKMVTICIGGEGAAFMQALAVLGDGQYIAVSG